MSSAPADLTGLSLNVPSVVDVEVAQAVFPFTRTVTGDLTLSIARANSMSDPRWCDRYSERVSADPLSRITTSAKRWPSARVLSPSDSAL